MKRLFNFLFVNNRNSNLIQKTGEVIGKMTLTEKMIFYALAAACAVSGIVILIRANDSLMVEVPAFGGSFTEGVIGNPRFINPVLALSDTDKDLSSLIYSGLLKENGDGSYAPNLAESYTISEDGTIYDFKLKNAYFHDGKKVTADDIAFTVSKVLDPVVKSPQKTAWEGVTVEKIDDNNMRFILKKPYTPFLDALTLGILPKHIWEKVSSEEFPFSEFNLNPVGTGPYKIKKVSSSGGIPSAIILEAYGRYASGKPEIKNIAFKFFQNEDALVKAYEAGVVDSAAGIVQEDALKIEQENKKVDAASLPRVFGVFFNQNTAPVFVNKEVRTALERAAPKQKIVDDVLLGFGQVLNGPTPANIETDPVAARGDIEAAKNYLLQKGWTENANGVLQKKTKSETTVLKFSIATLDSPELKQTAQILQDAWRQMGADVDVKIFEAGDLSQNVIKPRKYDALLFGEVVGNESDLYPFWHSSQRNDPGLNISIYTNITVDKELEKNQTEKDPAVAQAEREIVFSEIKNDVPAVFLFSPDFLYATAPQVKNINLKEISSPSERFISVDKWFIETDKVWKIFAANNTSVIE